MVRKLRFVSALLSVALLAVAGEGVLCALPCAVDAAGTGADASAAASHCRTGIIDTAVDLTMAPAAGSCDDHAGAAPPSERASTRASGHAPVAPRTHLGSDRLDRHDSAPVLPGRAEGSPPPLIAPLRI